MNYFNRSAAVLVVSAGLGWGQEPAPVPPEAPAAPRLADLLAQKIPPHPPSPPEPAIWKDRMRYEGKSRDSEERMYRRGSSHLDRREWDKAIEAFGEVIEDKGSRASGALYWKAYALNRLGRRNEALESLAQLQKQFPSDRWLNDAKALEVEVKQASGRGVSPEQETDEDLKLFAINSLIDNDPERAVPLLENLLQKQSSPRLKERALFVLAQSRTPRAREVVTKIAKGSGNPDLQMKAVEYLGIHRGQDSSEVLSEIYGSSSDAALKRKILHSFMVSGNKDRLLAAARSEPNTELRRESIQLLGAMGAHAELGQMYSSEGSPEVRGALLEAIFVSGNTDKLIEIAKTEKDVKLRRSAVQRLGHMRRGQAADALVPLYASETDREVKNSILDALSHQGNAKSLVELARKEQDPVLKREAVQKLSRMKSKEATDFLMELLNK